MRKVLVTGGAGFIGLHLVRSLVDAGDHVVVVDNMRRGRRDGLESDVKCGRVDLYEEDIRHLDALAALMRGCQVVYHLAAQSNVMGAGDDPEFSITTNVVGTFNVLRSAAAAGVARVVFASSREVYGDPGSVPVAEDAPLVPKNAYGASKVAAEAYCRSFASTHGLSVEILRLANVYGPGDSGRVIPLWLGAAQRNSDLEVYGGDQVIDFLWVGTAVDALLRAQRGLPGPVNIGSGTGTPILELAERVLAVTASKSQVALKPRRGVEVARYVADTRLMRAIGLTPEVDPLAHLGEVAGTVRG